MSTDYTHFSKIAFDSLFARGVDGSEITIFDASGNFTIPGYFATTAYFGSKPTITTAISNPGVILARTISGTGANARGYIDNSTFSDSATFAYASFDSAAATGGSNNLDHIVGFQSRITHGSSGTLSQFAAFTSVLNQLGGAVTDGWGFRYKSSGVGSTGTITNLYGLLVDDDTLGTNFYAAYLGTNSGSNRWNLYAAGTAPNFMQGSLTLASTLTTGTNKATFNSVIIGSAANTVTHVNSISSTGTLSVIAPLSTGTNKATHNSVVIGSAANTITHLSTLSSTGTLSVTAPITTGANKATHNSVIIGSAANTVAHVNTLSSTGTLTVTTNGSTCYTASTATLAITRVTTVASTLNVKAGNSTGTVARLGGRVYLDVATHTNTSTSLTVLSTTNLLANSLATNGDEIVVRGSGTQAANTNSKTIRVKFGGTQILGYAKASNGLDYSFECRIYRTGASAQRFTSLLRIGDTSVSGICYTQQGTTAIDTTGAITVESSGQSATASSDITQTSFTVDYFPAP